MKHYTTDPSRRAMSIATHIADTHFQKDHDISNYFEVLKQTFYKTLKELVEAENPEVGIPKRFKKQTLH
jgi:hypothetical protein